MAMTVNARQSSIISRNLCRKNRRSPTTHSHILSHFVTVVTDYRVQCPALIHWPQSNRNHLKTVSLTHSRKANATPETNRNVVCYQGLQRPAAAAVDKPHSVPPPPPSPTAATSPANKPPHSTPQPLPTNHVFILLCNTLLSVCSTRPTFFVHLVFIEIR